jgi:uncharacterized protein YxeA
MNKKTILILSIVLGASAVGYYFYKKKKEADNFIVTIDSVDKQNQKGEFTFQGVQYDFTLQGIGSYEGTKDYTLIVRTQDNKNVDFVLWKKNTSGAFSPIKTLKSVNLA